MPEDEWVNLSEVPLIADEAWLAKVREQTSTNGAHPEQEVSSWEPLNLAELEDRPPVLPNLGGLQLVYPGKRHVFSGPQESAKTLAAYVIGLAVVRAGQRVVLVDFEMGPWDAKTRLRELGATDEELASFLYVEPDVRATESAVGGLVQLAPSLVIVDAAAGAFQLESLDDNSRRDVERWAAAWVQPFWKAGIATIVLDHVVKNADLRGNYAIGSERKVGGADVHLGFSVITPIRRGGHGRYQVTTHKDRGGHLKRGKLATFELQSDPDTNLITWTFAPAPEFDEEHPFRPTGIMEKVSRFLEMHPGRVSRATIESAKLGKTDYVRSALDLLEGEGYLTQDPYEPGKPRWIELFRAYREDEDNLAPTSPHLAPFDKVNSSPVDSAPRGAGLRGEVHGGRGEVEGSPLELEDDIPF